MRLEHKLIGLKTSIDKLSLEADNSIINGLQHMVNLYVRAKSSVKTLKLKNQDTSKPSTKREKETETIYHNNAIEMLGNQHRFNNPLWNIKHRTGNIIPALMCSNFLYEGIKNRFFDPEQRSLVLGAIAVGFMGTIVYKLSKPIISGYKATVHIPTEEQANDPVYRQGMSEYRNNVNLASHTILDKYHQKIHERINRYQTNSQ